MSFLGYILMAVVSINQLYGFKMVIYKWIIYMGQKFIRIINGFKLSVKSSQHDL